MMFWKAGCDRIIGKSDESLRWDYGIMILSGKNEKNKRMKKAKRRKLERKRK